MNQDSKFKDIIRSPLVQSMLTWASINAVLISLFLVMWGNRWLWKALIIVPLAGALAGAIFYLLLNFHNKLNWSRAVATVVGGIIFIIGLWMSFILGLDPILWD